jgi:hypothetical protein
MKTQQEALRDFTNFGEAMADNDDPKTIEEMDQLYPPLLTVPFWASVTGSIVGYGLYIIALTLIFIHEPPSSGPVTLAAILAFLAGIGASSMMMAIFGAGNRTAIKSHWNLNVSRDFVFRANLPEGIGLDMNRLNPKKFMFWMAVQAVVFGLVMAGTILLVTAG